MVQSFQPIRQTLRSTVHKIFGFLAYALIFGTIYAQSPLYTSNQNQYFLHGLARAGWGLLENDWLANTLDPTPVFSALVWLTYSVFSIDIFFYAYYAILLAIYLLAVLGIVRQTIGFRNQASMFAFLALFFLAHSAALRFTLSRTLGEEWTFLFEGGVANQRLLGQVFQPSTFGVFLVLSISFFVSRKEYLAVFAQAVAVYFHPTYMLSAAILTLAYLWVISRENGFPLKSIQVAIVALALVLPISGYVYRSFGSAPTETTLAARQLLVNFRIPHHAVVSNWLNLTTIIQLALLGAAIYLMRQSRLFPVLLISSGLGFVLTLIQVVSGNVALALLFPWRISVILIPLSTSLILARLVDWGSSRLGTFLATRQNLILIISLTLIFVLSLVGITRFRLELERKASAPEKELMVYVDQSKHPGEVYLTPIKMQDFRLATGAPVYVEFKSIPYADAEVTEWYHRIQQANRVYNAQSLDCKLLEGLSRTEGVTHIVIENPTESVCADMVKQYEDSNFSVYKLSN